MDERKIGIRQMQDGTWAAGVVGWLDVLTDVAYGPTPWEASATAYTALGEDLRIEWETLPWTTVRIAHGIVAGVTHILGASLEARRAIDAANYEEEMRELGVSRYATLTAEQRATLAAAAAERILNDGVRPPSRREVERAAKWAHVAAVWLPGYGSAAKRLRAALDGGYPERRRARRLLERAWSALVGANARNDIAPDSR